MKFKFKGRNVQTFKPLLILKPEVVSIAHGARLDSFVKIEGGQGVSIGEHTHVASFCHLNIGGGELDIGSHVGIASGAKIVTGSNLKEGQSMSAASPKEMQVVGRSYVHIHRYAFIGVGAIIMPGVTLNEGAVVGAGAVVTHDVPPWEIWAGVPAKKIGVRE